MRLFRERMYFCQSLLTKKIKRIMKELVEKIAALVADGRTKILDSHCIDVSYPGFYDAFEHLL